MKFFPVKVVIICLIATPLLYVGSLIFAENLLNKTFTSQIENIVVGDSKQLLDGSVRLEEQIALNIKNFINNEPLIRIFNLDTDILVTTSEGRIIYPIFIDVGAVTKDNSFQLEKDQLAKHNFDLLEHGLKVSVKVKIPHGSSLGNLIFLLYSTTSFLFFLWFYRKSISKAEIEQQQHTQLVSQLKDREQTQKIHLDELKKERSRLFDDIQKLNSKYQENKDKAKINEEELFDEIISLEEKLNSYIESKQSTEREIDDLKSKIEKFEKRKSGKKKRVEADFISKRFSALYKNIVMTKKALAGYSGLTEDQQIKAEEIIFQLDRNPEQVLIKRKVFTGKKHKATSFEVLFAYNGRLYFNKDDNNITKILIIGTKNTQTKDMEYLHSL